MQIIISVIVCLMIAGCSQSSNDVTPISNKNHYDNVSISTASQTRKISNYPVPIASTTTASKSNIYLYEFDRAVLPASYSIQTKQTDFPIKIRSLSEKAIFRITMEKLIDNTSLHNDYVEGLAKIEIIDGPDIVFQEKFDGTYEDIQMIFFVGCKVLNGKDYDYFAYAVDYPIGSAEHFISYDLIRIAKEKQKYNIIKINGQLPSMEREFSSMSPDATIPNIQLDEGKYITVYEYETLRLSREIKYELTATSIHETDDEFKIMAILDANGEVMQYKSTMDNASSIDLYPDYSLEKKPVALKISSKSVVKVFGGRLTSNYYNAAIHINIDNHDGWVAIDDYKEKLGFQY